MTVEGVPFSGSSLFQPIDQQVKVFRHDDVSEDHETVTFAHLFRVSSAGDRDGYPAAVGDDNNCR
jgi:hypothetical protein